MPIPRPNDGESQTAFMARCQIAAAADFDDPDELAAACALAWDEAQDDDDGIGQAELRLSERAAPPPNGNPFEFVMSDASVDRMGDIIELDGWELDNFRKNPIALFGHDSKFPIGKWHDVKVTKDQLVGRLELMDPVSDRLREVHAAVAAGVLRAVSVGFRGVEFSPLDEKEPWGGLRFTKSELVECSLVSVPANPNALAVAKALGISRDTQSLIFGASADRRRQGRRRGLNGASADPKNPQTRTKTMTPSISDRIEVAQGAMVALQDKLHQHFEAHPTFDEDAQTIANDISGQIEAQKITLETLRRSEAAAAATVAAGSGSGSGFVPSTPSHVLMPAKTLPASTLPAVRPFALPKRKEEPGELVLHAAIVQGMMKFQNKSMDQALAERGWSDDMGVRAIVEWNQRAATTPANIATPAWAGALVAQQWSDLLSALTIKSVYGPLTGYGVRYTLGRYGIINIPVESTTPTIAGSFVAEGAPIPVRQGAFTTQQIGLKKMAVITSYTREMFEHSTPNIDAHLRDEIQRHTSVAIDTVLLDTNAATTIRPAGLRNGVAGLTPTAGGGFNALVGDIKQLLNVLVTANSVRVPVWIMNPIQAVSISLTQSSAGVGVFPFRAEIEAGMLNGFPVIQSSTVPVTTVILLDAADYASLTGDEPRFELSDVATLHMEDTTPLNISSPGTPNTVAAPVQSMFQTDSIALRMILPMNWIMRRSGLVAWLTGCTW
jgi:HK97 family phage major capsid protein/HK97 family phage prohead protease